MKNPNVLDVARNVMKHRYQDAAVGFAAGSVFRGEGSEFSDIDLVVLYDAPFDDVRRESFMAEGWPVEAFVHNVQAQNYFLDQDRESGIPVMISLISEGVEVPGPGVLSRQQKARALHLLQQGPPSLTAEQLGAKRYHLSDLLDDLRGVSKDDERYAILGKLYNDLADFHLRAKGHWSGRGKGLPRALRRHAPELADAYYATFYEAFHGGGVEKLIKLAGDILAPYGGSLFFYRQTAGSEWRSFGMSRLE